MGRKKPTVKTRRKKTKEMFSLQLKREIIDQAEQSTIHNEAELSHSSAEQYINPYHVFQQTDTPEEDISSSDINETLSMWSKVSDFIEKKHPKKVAVANAITLFDETCLAYFKNILNRRAKQSSVDIIHLENCREGGVENMAGKKRKLVKKKIEVNNDLVCLNKSPVVIKKEVQEEIQRPIFNGLKMEPYVRLERLKDTFIKSPVVQSATRNKRSSDLLEKPDCTVTEQRKRQSPVVQSTFPNKRTSDLLKKPDSNVIEQQKRQSPVVQTTFPNKRASDRLKKPDSILTEQRKRKSSVVHSASPSKKACDLSKKPDCTVTEKEKIPRLKLEPYILLERLENTSSNKQVVSSAASKMEDSICLTQLKRISTNKTENGKLKSSSDATFIPLMADERTGDSSDRINFSPTAQLRKWRMTQLRRKSSEQNSASVEEQLNAETDSQQSRCGGGNSVSLPEAIATTGPHSGEKVLGASSLIQTPNQGEIKSSSMDQLEMNDKPIEIPGSELPSCKQLSVDLVRLDNLETPVIQTVSPKKRASLLLHALTAKETSPVVQSASPNKKTSDLLKKPDSTVTGKKKRPAIQQVSPKKKPSSHLRIANNTVAEKENICRSTFGSYSSHHQLHKTGCLSSYQTEKTQTGIMVVIKEETIHNEGFVEQEELLPLEVILTEGEKEQQNKKQETESLPLQSVVLEEKDIKKEQVVPEAPDQEDLLLPFNAVFVEEYSEEHLNEKVEATSQELLTAPSTSEVYQCHLCSYKNKLRINYEAHLRTHTSKTSYNCELCPYRTMRMCNLTVHTRVHTGEKPFKCLLCENSFASRSVLRKHMRTHKEEKPFKCTFCEHGSTDKSEFDKHMMLCHAIIIPCNV